MNINVILVEDHEEYLNFLKILFKCKSEIRIIGSFRYGMEAMAAINSMQPDIIILDLDLPDISGIDIIKNIKSTKNHIDIIVLSKFYDNRHIFSSIKAGAVGYLLKDESNSEIANAVVRVYKKESAMTGSIMRCVLEDYHLSGNRNGKVRKNILTDREITVIYLLSEGLTPKKITKKLCVTYSCVRFHLKQIYNKLNVHSKEEAIAKAKSLGII